MKVRIYFDVEYFWHLITQSHMQYLETIGITLYDIVDEAMTLSGASFTRMTDDTAVNMLRYDRLEQTYQQSMGNNRPLLSQQPILNDQDAQNKFIAAVLAMYKTIQLPSATLLLQGVQPHELPVTIVSLDLARLENNTYIAEVQYERSSQPGW